MLKNNGFHNRHSPILRAFSPLSLFSGGAPGAWYDPSDYTTLFQDSAGTTPVTAVEQPVGRMLDKSGYGNHAFQATSASRPVLSARYNLLTKTEQFDDAAWTKNGVTVTANTATAPDGTVTADTITVNTLTTARYVRQSSLLSATAYAFSYVLKYTGSQRYLSLTLFDTVYKGCVFDIQNGAVTFSQSATGSVIDLGSGWYRCTIVATVSAGTVYYDLNPSNSSTAIAPAYTGNGTDNCYIWGASLVPANQSTLPYQRVNTPTDYATTGFLPYLKFDGVDDSLSTNSISFTGTDKMSVFAGVRKLSDAANAVVAEFSANASSNNGAFWLLAPLGAAANYNYASRGTNLANVSATPFSAPITNVVTGLGNISGDLATIRVNGIQVATDATDQGTGNYGNYPLYIGRRGGSSLPYNGQLYGLIIVGKAVTAGELSSTETYVNQKTGAY